VIVNEEAERKNGKSQEFAKGFRRKMVEDRLSGDVPTRARETGLAAAGSPQSADTPPGGTRHSHAAVAPPSDVMKSRRLSRGERRVGAHGLNGRRRRQ
jgi:hypothetical protein